jgi:hypothetical protein
MMPIKKNDIMEHISIVRALIGIVFAAIESIKFVTADLGRALAGYIDFRVKSKAVIMKQER